MPLKVSAPGLTGHLARVPGAAEHDGAGQLGVLIVPTGMG